MAQLAALREELDRVVAAVARVHTELGGRWRRLLGLDGGCGRTIFAVPAAKCAAIRSTGAAQPGETADRAGQWCGPGKIGPGVNRAGERVVFSQRERAGTQLVGRDVQSWSEAQWQRRWLAGEQRTGAGPTWQSRPCVPAR
jgi:hypothetical protein